MGKGTTTSNDYLLYVFNSTAMPSYGSAGGTLLWVALSTGTLTASSTQLTTEAAYVSYARQSVTRSGSGGWTVSTNTATNANLISFPQCTGGSETETYTSIGTTQSAAGQVLYFGALNSSLAVSNNITPQFAATQLTLTET